MHQVPSSNKIYEVIENNEWAFSRLIYWIKVPLIIWTQAEIYCQTSHNEYGLAYFCITFPCLLLYNFICHIFTTLPFCFPCFLSCLRRVLSPNFSKLFNGVFINMDTFLLPNHFVKIIMEEEVVSWAADYCLSSLPR